MADNLLLTGDILCQKWKDFTNLAGVPDDEHLNLSEGWLSSFKARNGLKNVKWHAKFCRMPSDCGLADKQNSGVKGKKLWLTYLFTMNADGSKKLPLLIIGKAQKPWAFKNKTGTQLGFHYRNNVKAWMTAALYQEWLLDWDRKLRNEDRKILLLQDNFAGHIVPETLTNIHVVNVEPNLTAHVQPNDQGIIHCFKAKYRARFIHHAIHLYETGTAWNEVNTMTIRNCWRKANILPNTDSSTSPSLVQPFISISSLIHTADSCGSNNPGIVQAKNAVHDALDDLQATGALQWSNQMDVAELLNPTAKTYNIFDATDDDIYQAVMDAKVVREASNEVNSNEVMVDNNEPVEPGPTCNEALKAALVLGKYINDFDDPFMRQLKSMLGLVGKKTRVLKMQTMTDVKKLTSYFRPIQQCQ
ncbi:DDE-domain-containing protein [Gyrodon lividus]|nr:DDE-domain-containing protein [Gyrodon lividus]